jgi:hypothetical protein
MLYLFYLNLKEIVKLSEGKKPKVPLPNPLSGPPTPGPPEADQKALTPIQLPRKLNPLEDQKALTPIQIPRVLNPESDEKSLTPILLPRKPNPEDELPKERLRRAKPK